MMIQVHYKLHYDKKLFIKAYCVKKKQFFQTHTSKNEVIK